VNDLTQKAAILSEMFIDTLFETENHNEGKEK
jgi:hypothetical protein